MIVKTDKSEEFIKSERKLISEYDGDRYFEDEKEIEPQFLKED